MRFKTLLPALSLALAVTACSRADADHYARVESGMTRDEVHAILGNPDDVSGGSLGGFSMSTETWQGSRQTISITFAGDKVALKSIQPRGSK